LGLIAHAACPAVRALAVTCAQVRMVHSVEHPKAPCSAQLDAALQVRRTDECACECVRACMHACVCARMNESVRVNTCAHRSQKSMLAEAGAPTVNCARQRGGWLAQVVQVCAAVGGARGDKMRGGGVELNAAHIGLQAGTEGGG